MSTPDITSPRDSRTAVACLKCKASKIRCGGMPGTTCTNCFKAGAECEYPPPGKKTYIPEIYVQGLKKQIRDLEARIQELELEHTLSEFIADPALLDEEVIPDEYNSMFTGMENLFLSRSGDHDSHEQFVGSGATVVWARTLGGKAENWSWDIDPQDRDPSWLRRPPSPSYMPLPPPEVARHFYKSQHEYIGTIFAFVQRDDFDARLQEFYQNPLPDSSSQESCLKYCQVMLVCAYGELYSVNQWTLEGPPGLKFFKQAIRYLPNAHEAGSVLFVEVLGLAGYYFQVLNRRDAAFLYIGMALRMATSLGLHQELSENANVSSVEREHRRRVWWSVYSMDRIISVKWGNPLTIHDEDIGVHPPSYTQELDGQSTSANVLACYSGLSKILGQIGENIYRRKHTDSNTLLTAIKLIISKLSTWSRALPVELCIDPSTLGLYISREAVSTHLHYYQCLHMTARPLLFSVTQKRLEAIRSRTATSDWRTGLPHSVIVIIEHAIDGARRSTEITSAALSKNLVATYGFMDGEHAFSSALTLVMANIALDNSQANALGMKAAMNVLESMAQRGNRYVAYRHALLQKLRATIPNKEHSSTTQLQQAFHNPEIVPPSPSLQTGSNTGSTASANANMVVDAPGNVVNDTTFQHNLPITRPVTNIYAASPFTASASALYASASVSATDGQRQGVFPDFYALEEEMQDVGPQPPYDFNIDDHFYSGVHDDQAFIGAMQNLQQQIRE